MRYFDDIKKLAYINLVDENRRLKLDKMVFDFAYYFNNLASNSVKYPSEIKKDQLLCTKYYLDNNWYRVKVMQEPNGLTEKLLVSFVDYGNEEHVLIKELREIPDIFIEYKQMPFQVSFNLIFI